MVLDYLEKPASYDQIVKLINISPDLGAPASNVKRLFPLVSKVIYESGTLLDLETWLKQDLPCIAFVNTVQLSYWEENARHAVVVIGVDERQVYLDDPLFDAAPQVVSRLEFELAWDEMDNRYAVFVP